MTDKEFSFPLERDLKKIIIIRSGEIDHLKRILDFLSKANDNIEITCIVQKEFEKAAFAERRISKIIVMEKIGDYSFKLSPKALFKIRRNEYDLAIVMERAGGEARDRRVHLLASLIKARKKIISTPDGNYRDFNLKIPLGNLPEVILSNLISFTDIILAKITRLLLIPLLFILKHLKDYETTRKDR